jgi:DNA end-binding protein Ku
VRPMRDGDVLGMSTMLFADEVVPPDKIEELEAVEEVDTSKRELDIAKQLVDSLAGDFEPERYHDSYREQVVDLIERKAAGEEIAVQPAAEEEEEPVPDLMAALKASLDAVREQEPAGNGDGGRDGNGKGSSKSSSKKAPARKKAPAKS